MKPIYRVAVIGSTRKGGYGHGLDTAFQGVARAKIVAVADDDPVGLAAAGKRLGVEKLYVDYRALLKRERPDIVCIGPRWVTERVPMVEAAAAAGCHIYCEKPLAGTLADADRILAACTQGGVKVAVAHQWRATPPIRQAIRDVRAQKYGRLLRVWARPKDDARGGGEELIVHGTHLFDMLIALAGPPRWAAAHIAVGDRDATREDAREGTEPVGPIAGNSIAATFGFDRGVRAFYDSTANLHRAGQTPPENLYGLRLECEQAQLCFWPPGDVYVYASPVVQPDRDDLTWEKQWIEDWHFTPEHQPRDVRREWIPVGNRTLAADLIAAIEENRDPFTSGKNALYITEMVQGVYASHLTEGRRLPIPLRDRRHPLTSA
ncbi:MAG: Gfo/Idh/MocA family oxidoreductase [Planctomycetes bacterium]|nr:Gfo/Idh/MocA family oxidoreductase [Planctomycetota bacterium]